MKSSSTRIECILSSIFFQLSVILGSDTLVLGTEGGVIIGGLVGLTCATGLIVGIEWIEGGSGAWLEGLTGLLVVGGGGAVKGLLLRAVIGTAEGAASFSSVLFWFIRV